MPDVIIGTLIAIISPFAFATVAIVARVGLQGFSPTTGAMISLFSGWLLLGSVTAIFYLDDLLAVAPINFVWFLLGGVVGFVMGRVFVFNAIARIGASRTYAIYCTYPLYGTALSILLFEDEVLSILTVIGTIACFLGTVMTVLARVSSDRIPSPQINASSGGSSAATLPWTTRLTSPVVLGSISAVVAGMSYGIFFVIGKKLIGGGESPFVAATFTLLFGGIVLFVLLGKKGPRDIRAASKRSLLLIFISGIAASIGVITTYVALQFAPVAVVAPISALSPVLVIFLSKIFLRDIDQITPRIVLSTLIVVGGVVSVVLGAGG